MARGSSRLASRRRTSRRGPISAVLCRAALLGGSGGTAWSTGKSLVLSSYSFLAPEVFFNSTFASRGSFRGRGNQLFRSKKRERRRRAASEVRVDRKGRARKALVHGCGHKSGLKKRIPVFETPRVTKRPYLGCIVPKKNCCWLWQDGSVNYHVALAI